MWWIFPLIEIQFLGRSGYKNFSRMWCLPQRWTGSSHRQAAWPEQSALCFEAAAVWHQATGGVCCPALWTVCLKESSLQQVALQTDRHTDTRTDRHTDCGAEKQAVGSGWESFLFSLHFRPRAKSLVKFPRALSSTLSWNLLIFLLCNISCFTGCWAYNEQILKRGNYFLLKVDDKAVG